MSSKSTVRVLIAKDSAGNVTAIGVPASKFANKIGLHAPDGGTVETLEIPVRSKSQTTPLDPKTLEELLESGRLKTHAPQTRSKRR